MEDKPDWANISGDEEEERDDEQHESGQNERNESQPGQPYQQRAPYTGTRGTSRGGRGRGSRGGPRGGPRGEHRGEHRGDRGDQRGDRGDRGDRPPKVKESQPAQEMIGMIKRGRDENPLINLFDVDYKATEEDIRKVYADVHIESVNMIKPGLFLLELQKDEAIKLVEAGAKSVYNRPFFMKLGYSNKRQNPEEQWHTVNSEKHKNQVGQREDRQPKGKRPPYNRKEQNDFGGDDSQGQNRPFQKQNRGPRPQEPVEMDPNNKFFKGHDLSSNEFRIKFTNSSTKKDEGNTEGQQGVNKPNPFGDAKARDESDYQKKKEIQDEKDQVKDLQEHFEEKKDQLKDNKKGLPTPVNSPNTEFTEEGGQGRSAPPGISKGGIKKSGFTAKGPQGGYDNKGNDSQQRAQGAGEEKAAPQDEGKKLTNKTSNKFNQFAFLE